GKIEIDETPQQCLKREIREELEVDIVVGNYLGESICTYSNSKIKLIAYFATILSGDIKLSVHDKVEWITISEFDEYEFAPADIPFIAKLKEIF
ncbi:(deoxy)nucleoside triphosphate pyrophosphohydrolase, partial [uncultured Clostridium sp.]